MIDLFILMLCTYYSTAKSGYGSVVLNNQIENILYIGNQTVYVDYDL